MLRRPTALLPRLLADGVLPCALAALALTATLTIRQLRDMDDMAHMRIALHLEQLSTALDRDAGHATQRLLDDALRMGEADRLQRIDLQQTDGVQLHSGAPTAAPLEDYRRESPVGDGRHRTLTLHVDPQARWHAQRLVWLYGALNSFGIVLLTLLAMHSMRYRVLQPLQRMQRALDDLLSGANSIAQTDEAHREFARLQTSTSALAALLAANRLDRTSIQRATAIDALDQLRQSQAASRSKTQFMALVGHHFRQPLQAMQLITASLHPGIDAEQQALLAQMHTSIGVMTKLLDALLEISQLDAGVVEVASAPFGVADLFLHDRSWQLDDARQHNVSLIWRVSHHHLHGDVELTAALLRQLVSNAIACSGAHGRVLVAARWRRHGVRIEVRDNGVGIAAIHQQRIFEEFVQLHGDGDRRDGYGLGLAIAARLAQVLGTQIGLRSEPGRGSTFWFELPDMMAIERHGSADARRALPLMR
ncbi:HAMP domain-containing sensor histidine kinase [Rhodanobacter sp. C03]|uniref:sensor histidine kinase n=1 Tax=Rhodanobacter sp. C03 TaxID=1945858 RepID=UPI001438E6C3|nr:HAMP domain-containing sensor histidine kinase [Rhodanobacter sp. C03]